jgi:hypothetical protein
MRAGSVSAQEIRNNLRRSLLARDYLPKKEKKEEQLMVYHYYKCDACGRQRKWGATTTRFGFEVVPDPVLLCEGECGIATAHAFVELRHQVFAAFETRL